MKMDSDGFMVSAELSCSICFSVFFQPITAPQCHHSFCRKCLSQVMEQKTTCPLCRQHFPANFSVETATENENLAAEARRRYPEEYKEREEEWKRELEERKFILMKKVIIGNEHQVTPRQNNVSHIWKLYIRDGATSPLDEPQPPISQLIEKVEISLHPTFQPSRVVLKRAPFEIQRIGWGTFEVGIKVFFHPELNLPPYEDAWHLSFDSRDRFKPVVWKFDLRKIQLLPQDASDQGNEPDDETEFQARTRRLQELLLNRH